jgi:hypothetical protein
MIRSALPAARCDAVASPSARDWTRPLAELDQILVTMLARRLASSLAGQTDEIDVDEDFGD